MGSSPRWSSWHPVAGSIVYGPRGVAHAFRVDSAEARLLQFMDKQALKEIGAKYSQEFVGPPLPPKD